MLKSRFVLFEKGDNGVTATQPIVPDIKYSPGEYVQTPSQRDFFYLVRRDSRTSSADASKPSG